MRFFKWETYENLCNFHFLDVVKMAFKDAGDRYIFFSSCNHNWFLLIVENKMWWNRRRVLVYAVTLELNSFTLILLLIYEQVFLKMDKCGVLVPGGSLSCWETEAIWNCSQKLQFLVFSLYVTLQKSIDPHYVKIPKCTAEISMSTTLCQKQFGFLWLFYLFIVTV